MQSFDHIIRDPLGLHARPAGKLVRTAAPFQSRVTLHCGEKQAEGDRLMALMLLGAKQGTILHAEIDGADEDACASALRECLEQNL